MWCLHCPHLWEGSKDMELEMKFTERDKKLIVFLSLFLLIVGLGYFVVKPLYEKVQELSAQADDLEMQVQQTQSYLARLPQLRKTNEELLDNKRDELQIFYEYMPSQELDKMITELTLHQSLGAKNLTITIPDAPYAIAPYFLYLPPAEEDGEQMTEAEAAYEAEKADNSQPQETESTETDPAAMILYVANLSIDVTGSHEKLQDYIDLLSDDEQYPALQVNSYSWSTDNRVSTDELGDLDLRSEDMLHMELSVYMQGKEEE